MIDLLFWMKAHWQDLALICTGIVTAASVVVKLTPTPADDAFLAKVITVLDKLALNPKR